MRFNIFKKAFSSCIGIYCPKLPSTSDAFSESISTRWRCPRWGKIDKHLTMCLNRTSLRQNMLSRFSH